MCFNKRCLKSSSLSFRFIGHVWVVVINEDTQSAFYHPERRSRSEVWAECQHSAKSNTVQRTTGFKLIPQIPELSAAPAAVCLQLGSNDRLAFAIQPVYKKNNPARTNAFVLIQLSSEVFLNKTPLPLKHDLRFGGRANAR